jgi:hypothetical protein
MTESEHGHGETLLEILEAWRRAIGLLQPPSEADLDMLPVELPPVSSEQVDAIPNRVEEWRQAADRLTRDACLYVLRHQTDPEHFDIALEAATRVARAANAMLLMFADVHTFFVPSQERGRKIVDAARHGGHTRAKGPSSAQLCCEVQQMHQQRPRWSWSSACGCVAELHGISDRTVRRKTDAVKW